MKVQAISLIEVLIVLVLLSIVSIVGLQFYTYSSQLYNQFIQKSSDKIAQEISLYKLQQSIESADLVLRRSSKEISVTKNESNLLYQLNKQELTSIKDNGEVDTFALMIDDIDMIYKGEYQTTVGLIDKLEINYKTAKGLNGKYEINKKYDSTTLYDYERHQDQYH